jgi:integrase
MGKRWRKYQVGRYRLGRLHGEAVVGWRGDDGKKHRHRLGVFSEGEGRIALDTFVGNVQALNGRGGITFKMVWDDYYADRKKDGKLMAAFDDNWKALEPRFGAMRVTDVTNDICRAYARERLERGRLIRRKGTDGKPEEVRLPIRVGTVWSELLRLRSAVNWAWDHNRLVGLGLDKKPKIWIPRKPDPKQRVLSVEEFVRLRDACAAWPHLRLFVILAITTAARTEAILQLTWRRVDFSAGTIDLRDPEGVVDPLSKRARKGRALVLMTPEARAALEEAKDGALTDYVIEWDEAPVKCIRRSFLGAVRRAGLGEAIADPTRPGKTKWVTDVTPHTLRHSVLSWLEEDGVDEKYISRLAAHSGPEITRKLYIHPRVEALKEAAEAIERRTQQSPRLAITSARPSQT